MKCYTGGTLARFPSGQRGWTQDPLRKKLAGSNPALATIDNQ